MKEKKILIISLEYPPQIGGIASYVYDYSKHLKEKFCILAPKQENALGFDKNSGLKVYRKKLFLPLFIKWISLIWHSFIILRKEKSNFIHIHHILPVGYVGLFFEKFLKIPYIIFFHGADLEFATRNKRKKFFAKKICKHAKEIIVNSDYMKRRLLMLFEDLEENKIKIIYPCPADKYVEEEKDNNRTEEIIDRLALRGKKVVLSVSRLAERKGHPIFARILPEIIKKIPNLVWVIIGEGKERDNIYKAIKENNLESVVRFLPAITGPQLINYYDIADIFLLLTHKDDDGVEEAWGITFLEAAARGLPSVAGRSGGVEEAVLHLKTGLVLDVNQEKQMINNISDLLLREDFARNLGETGRFRVQNEFRWDMQISKLDK